MSNSKKFKKIADTHIQSEVDHTRDWLIERAKKNAVYGFYNLQFDSGNMDLVTPQLEALGFKVHKVDNGPLPYLMSWN